MSPTKFLRRAYHLILLVFGLTLGFSQSADAQGPPTNELTAKPASQASVEAESASVVFDGDVLYAVKGSQGSLTVEERAETISNYIKRLADDPFFNPDDVTIEDEAKASKMMYRGQLLGKITDDDAALYGKLRQDLAAERVQIIRDAIKRYRARRTPAAFNRAILWATGGAGILVLLMIGLRRLHRLIMAWVERSYKAGKCIRFQQKEILDPMRLANYRRRIIKALEWGLGILLIFIYLQVVFSVIPLTRALALGILRYVSDPLGSLWHSLLFQLDNIFYIVVIVVLVRYCLKALKWIFTEAAAGQIWLPGLQREWAIPMYKLIRLVILAFAAVIIYPYVPGSDSAAFKGISLFAGVVFSLGSTGIAGQFMGGLILMAMKPFKIGDRVEVGGVTGDVVALSLASTRIRTIKNEEVTIPNSQALSGKLVNYSTLALGDGLILHTSVTIGYDAPWRKVHELLIGAALKTEGILHTPAPFVLQTALNDFYVTYEINAYTRDACSMPVLYARLHQNIQDGFNESGVEIMSAHYSYLRDGNAITIPEKYRPEGYTAPTFGVHMEKKDRKQD